MPDEAPGTLRVHVESPSMFLSGSLPFEVRDADQRVVARGHGSTSMDLDPGCYSVSLLLSTGERADRIASVASAEATDIAFREAVEAEPPPALLVLPPRLAVPAADETVYAGAEMDAGGEAVDEVAEEPALRPVDVLLQDVHGAVASEVSATMWEFVADYEPDTVPTATFQVAGRGQVVVSLPVNPQGDFAELTACRVLVDRTHDQPMLTTVFHPRRQVASALGGVLRTGELMSSMVVLREAADLLFHKYRDPPAAALGALTLHRLGRLDDRRHWVQNLAHGFTWLPDGPLLLAALLRDDPDPRERERGLAVLLEATARRPLYTDGLSLALELLRRWHPTEAKDERYDRLEHLSAYSATAMWDALTLTTVEDALTPGGDAR